MQENARQSPLDSFELDSLNLNDHLRETLQDVQETTIQTRDEQKEGLALSFEQVRLLSEVSVTLSIECGEIKINAEELLDLVPGKTFEVPIAKDALLYLRIGDEVLASARFIRQGTELGLEVLEVMSHEKEL